MTSWLSPRRLAGLAAPMTVWALHFVAVYGAQGVACSDHGPRAGPWGATSWLLVLLTVIALAVIAGLGIRAWRVVHGSDAGSDASGDRDRFMSAATALLALLAAIAVVFTATPILMLAPCA